LAAKNISRRHIDEGLVDDRGRLDIFNVGRVGAGWYPIVDNANAMKD
jgi:hypothetical protein